MKLKWVTDKIVERYGFQPKVRKWRYGMSLPLVRKIGPEDSIKTVTTQFCLFHFFSNFNLKHINIGKLTAIFILFRYG